MYAFLTSRKWDTNLNVLSSLGVTFFLFLFLNCFSEDSSTVFKTPAKNVLTLISSSIQKAAWCLLGPVVVTMITEQNPLS